MQHGYYDPLPLAAVSAAARSLRDFFATRKTPILDEIRTKAALDKDLEAKIQTAADEWKQTQPAPAAKA